MSKLLQVRVSVSTLDIAAVERAWPTLWDMAYPPGNDYAPARQGVLELVDTLHARMAAGELSPAIRKGLTPGLEAVSGLVRSLQDALGTWNVHEAQALTQKIEDALDALEDRAGTL
ncbi:hypothetical protein [Fundidesulfovibrio soli]|uniref:hypothetical protein n=1 Tax=Fundidesulfovibrio soli TaxID=2922716 RepID=UPI001FAFB648|nr:hypothetical protein [Fundidesulfovibrio soli]